MNETRDVMHMETYSLTKARMEEMDSRDLRRFFKMIENAYRLAEFAHEDSVEMAVESPGPQDPHVQTYVLWSAHGLELSVYVQALRQTLADLCGR